MPTFTVFCSATDHDVPLVARSEKRDWRATLPVLTSGDVTCLEHGVRCTGSLCPFLAVGPERRDSSGTEHGGASAPL
jgi:hypothetical protein